MARLSTIKSEQKPAPTFKGCLLSWLGVIGFFGAIIGLVVLSEDSDDSDYSSDSEYAPDELSEIRDSLASSTDDSLLSRPAYVVNAFYDDMSVSRSLEFADEIPLPQNPPCLVNDFAGMMSDDSVRLLERRLIDFCDSTTNQICVVTLDSLFGYELADYTHAIFDSWGIGTANRDNGVLILLKNKTQYEGGDVFIMTGYGLEGTLPDITCSHIISDEMIPHLVLGENSQAIFAGADAVVKATSSEFKTSLSDEPMSDEDLLLLVCIFFLLPLAIGYVYVYLKFDHKRMSWIVIFGMSLLLGYVALFALMGRGGGSSGSGRSGGGFGGFGGGKSGGGGAGGHW